MLTTGVRTPVGIKIYGSDLAEIERARHRGRGGPAGRARHAQRLRRAGRGRVLRGPRPAARRDRAVRPQRRRRAGRRHVRDRRGERHHHDRGPRALPGERPLPARPEERPRDARPRAGHDPFRGAGPARPGRGHPHRHRPLHDPQRERAPRGLRLRGHHGPRRGRLRGGREARGRGRREAAGGLRPGVERPVREHAARHRAAEARGAVHALPDPLPPLRQHEVPGQDADRRPRRALLRGRRGLAAVGPRLQRLDRGVGRA